MDKSKIEWTDATWNPVRGCSLVSAGCTNCYAMRVAHRSFTSSDMPYHGLTRISGGRPVWNGEIKLVRSMLRQPLVWKRPRRIFVNSMSDLFHEKVPFEFIDDVFEVMLQAHWHTFQILTKRPERMLEWWEWTKAHGKVKDIPMNAHMGVSIEDQPAADQRLPLLRMLPAAVRWISAEPLLAAVNIRPALGLTFDDVLVHMPWLNWVVVGGESGPGARPMHEEWARMLRDQCVAAGVPFFFKQWGDFAPDSFAFAHLRSAPYDPAAGMVRVGKKNAGRELDGRTWDEYPA